MNRAQAVDEAIAQVVALDDTEGRVFVHTNQCALGSDPNGECSCGGYWLMVPPADSAALWVWMRRLDGHARGHFRTER